MGHGIITRRGIDTSSATATTNKIVAPYTAFVNGVKLTGDVVDYSGSAVAGTPYNVDGNGNFGVLIPNSGVYSQNEIVYASASSVGINAEKIIEGHSILGVTGTQSLYEEDDLEVLDLTGYNFVGKSNGGNPTAINVNSYTQLAVIGSGPTPGFNVANSSSDTSSSAVLFRYNGDANKLFVVRMNKIPTHVYIQCPAGCDLVIFGK